MRFVPFRLFRVIPGDHEEAAADVERGEDFEFASGWPQTSMPIPPPTPSFTLGPPETFELVDGWP